MPSNIILAFIVFLYLCVPSHAASTATINNKDEKVSQANKRQCDGFRDYCWGDLKSSIKGLKFLRTDPSYGGVEDYTISGDKLNIGEAKMDKIVYGFIDGKLQSVQIVFSNLANFSNLKESVSAKYGELYNARHSEKYIGESGDTGIYLEFSEIRDKGMLYLYSKSMRGEAEKKSLEKAKTKGANDL